MDIIGETRLWRELEQLRGLVDTVKRLEQEHLALSNQYHEICTEFATVLLENRKLRRSLEAIRDFKDWVEPKDTANGDTEQALTEDIGKLLRLAEDALK